MRLHSVVRPHLDSFTPLLAADACDRSLFRPAVALERDSLRSNDANGFRLQSTRANANDWSLDADPARSRSLEEGGDGDDAAGGAVLAAMAERVAESSACSAAL